MANLKFYWNGLKEDGGKLQPYYLSMGHYTAESGHDALAISVSARGYAHFSKGVWEQFAVRNDSDSMTDYFDKDDFKVQPSHPLYPEVLAAYKKRRAHDHARHIKWCISRKQAVPPPYDYDLEAANLVAQASERHAMMARKPQSAKPMVLAPEYLAPVMSEDALLRLQSASRFAC